MARKKPNQLVAKSDPRFKAAWKLIQIRDSLHSHLNKLEALNVDLWQGEIGDSARKMHTLILDLLGIPKDGPDFKRDAYYDFTTRHSYPIAVANAADIPNLEKGLDTLLETVRFDDLPDPLSY